MVPRAARMALPASTRPGTSLFRAVPYLPMIALCQATSTGILPPPGRPPSAMRHRATIPRAGPSGTPRNAARWSSGVPYISPRSSSPAMSRLPLNLRCHSAQPNLALDLRCPLSRRLDPRRGARLHRHQDLGEAPRPGGHDQRLPAACAAVRLPAAPGRHRGGAGVPGDGQGDPHAAATVRQPPASTLEGLILPVSEPAAEAVPPGAAVRVVDHPVQRGCP